jgi:hypothetical protein
MSADVLIMPNIPSREGYIATFSSLPIMSQMDPLLVFLQKFVKEVLPSHTIQLRHFHSDGGA